MGPQARTIWDGLQFRTPAILRTVDAVSEEQFYWHAPNGGNSIAWLLCHIAEVEDNWARDKLLGLPRRFPFGRSCTRLPISMLVAPSVLASVACAHCCEDACEMP